MPRSHRVGAILGRILGSIAQRFTIRPSVERLHFMFGKFTGGSVQQVINLGDLRRVSVPLPPHTEQRRIVAILDEAFEAIATAKANAEKNLRNAREVFDSQLTVVLQQGGEGWIETSIADVCTLRSGTTVPTEIERPTGDVP